MNRRNFCAALLASTAAPALAQDAAPRLLVLIELRGGCDGLNVVVPVDSGVYHDLRPRLALRPEAVLRWPGAPALHPELAALEPLWRAGEMAVVQGVGYPTPNLSHFRSIEIWDTASDSEQILQQGWLTRVARDRAAFRAMSADGVVIGAADLGPLAGGARAVSMTDPARFAREARLAASGSAPARGALAHLQRVENDIVRAGAEIRPALNFHAEFPRGLFGAAAQNAAAIAATGKVPVIRLTLPGFDTHQNQAPVQAALLRQLAEAIAGLRLALVEQGVWDRTLVLTYSEFGRRPRENQSGGTDHGTASSLFAFGPRVRGATYGEAPSLTALDAGGNLHHTVDFRSVYATVLQDWWQIPAEAILQRPFKPVPFLRT